MIPEGAYTVVEVLDDGALRSVPADVAATLEIQGRRVSGSAGCNRFMGEIDEEGTLGPLATTMMACPPPIMEFEQQLLGLLGRVNGSRVSGSATYLIEDDIDLVHLSTK